MNLPRGVSYKFLSTSGISLKDLLKELGDDAFTGYLRLTVERKEGLEDGYLLFKKGVVIGAEYVHAHTNYSKEAYKMIVNAWKLVGIVDLNSFTDFQVALTMEENRKALYPGVAVPVAEHAPIQKKKETGFEIKNIPEVEEEIPGNEEELFSIKTEESLAEEILERRKERLALLKKFGIREPDEEFLKAVLAGHDLPSERELNQTSREIKIEILKALQKRFEEIDLYINPARLNNKVTFSIDVYVKPYNHEVEEEVKHAIESILQEKLSFPYGKGLNIIEAKV